MARARKQIRRNELVAKVFQATLAEVGRVGVEHLSIEEVAERADVNKTTIYRRWPTPEGLAHHVREAVAAGLAEIVLDDFTLKPVPAHAVWPSGSRMTSLVRRFVDLLAQRLKKDVI
jgi:AcrR family transcriptional regulator